MQRTLLASLLLCIVSNFLLAQNQRYLYEYKFIPDSTNKAAVITENMFLDTSKEGSLFYSEDVYKSDSIRKVMLEKQIQSQKNSMNMSFNLSDKPKGKVRYKVSKTYPDYNTFLLAQISGDAYQVSDPRNFEWKISPEKEKIGEWQAQKAEADFGGRHWIAWFATEIPLQDGPYKFHGLPGLIVKIADKTGSHQFELKGVKNSYVKYDSENQMRSTKYINIDLAQYKKLIKDYEQDPLKSLRQMMSSGDVKMMGPNGEQMDNATLLKKREVSVRETMKKNNNKIELSYD